MATFGLTYVLIGAGQLVFGGDSKIMITEQLYLPKGAININALGGLITLQKLDIAAAVIATVMRNCTTCWVAGRQRFRICHD